MNIKRLTGLLSNMLIVLILAVGISIIVLRISGVYIFAVETGSMGEEYPIGTMILVKSTDTNKITQGDVITFVADEKLTVVTHRVVERNDEKRYFITRGDTNNISDAPVSFENVIGKVVYKIEYIGYCFMVIHRPKVRICLYFVFAILVFSAVIQLYKDTKEKVERENDCT